MKKIEISCRDLYELIKSNESIFEEFINKPISEFTYDDFMYCLYYNSDNIIVGEIEDYMNENNYNKRKQDFTGWKKVKTFNPNL